jgi:transposase
MHYGASQLGALVQEEIPHGVYSGDRFMFCGWQRRMIRILYWDRNGFCIWQKFLGRDRFPWPRVYSGFKLITPAEVDLIFRGIDFWHEHQELEYKKIY